MPHPCKVDLRHDPLIRQIAKLKRKFPNLELDIRSVAKILESDYTARSLSAVRIQMDVDGCTDEEVWKYEFRSADPDASDTGPHKNFVLI